jgi:hypothetical protein
MKSRILFRVIQQCLLLMLLFSLMGPAKLITAQDEEAARRAAEAEREAARERAAAEEMRRMQQRSIDAMREFLNDTGPDISRSSEDASIRRNYATRRRTRLMEEALHQISIAAEEFRQGLGFEIPLKGSAKKFDDSSDVFLDVVREHNKEHPRFDSGEFKDFTASELAWEALTTAERILPHLDTLVRSERESSIDIRFIQTLPQLELDLRRLQWMARRLK